MGASRGKLTAVATGCGLTALLIFAVLERAALVDRFREWLASRRFEEYGMAVAETARGLKVTRVMEGGPAATAGFRRGDLLRMVDGVPCTSMKDLVEDLTGSRSTMIFYARGNAVRSCEIVIPGAPPIDPERLRKISRQIDSGPPPRVIFGTGEGLSTPEIEGEAR